MIRLRTKWGAVIAAGAVGAALSLSLASPLPALADELAEADALASSDHGVAVVVADSRSPRDGRFIEEVGRYNPLTNPKVIDLDLEKIADWQSKGAQLTDSVAALVRAAEAGPKAATEQKKSKKQLAREAEEAKRAAEAAAEAEGSEE